MTVPDQAIDSAAQSAMAYEPTAVAALSTTPGRLLSVLSEMSRRAVEAAAPAIHEAGVHEGVRLERQRIADAATFSGYVQRLEEIARIARDMFACIDDADYPPQEHIDHWRAILAAKP